MVSFALSDAQSLQHVASDSHTIGLFRAAKNGCSEVARIRARAELIESHLEFATSLASRFRNRGVQFEDLKQVAALGLIKAVDGYDPGQGPNILSYAAPTILGELRRYFRDRTWSMHVPRRLQEITLAISASRDQLTHQLRRSPTVTEIGADTRLSQRDVLDGLRCMAADHTVSLDRPLNRENLDGTVADLLGELDCRLAALEDRESLRPLLRALSLRDQRILVLRFVDGLSQAQIAIEIGISQIQVSRLLRHCLSALRQQLLATA